MKHPGRHGLARALVCALALKAAILFGLWSAFFSQPQTRNMRLPTAQVEQRLLTAPAPTPPEEVKDDIH